MTEEGFYRGSDFDMDYCIYKTDNGVVYFYGKFGRCWVKSGLSAKQLRNAWGAFERISEEEAFLELL